MKKGFSTCNRTARPILSEIVAHAESAPDNMAIGLRHESVSYGAVVRKISAAAALLRDYGVGSGERVILVASSTPSFVYAYFATHAIGAIAVPVDPQLTDYHLEHIVDQVDPTLILVDREFSYRDHTVEPISQCDRDWAEPYELKTPSLEDTADILFTTGTSGKPKGVELTHRNVAAAAKNINEFIGNNSEDRELVPLPLSHSFGLGRLRCNMLAGGAIILADGFMFPGRLFEAMEYWTATGFSFVPAGLSVLYKLSGDKLAQYAEQLRYIEIGSAPMPLEHKERLMRILPKTRICMHYGLTEASRAAFIEMHESPGKLSSVGMPSPNVEIRVVDSTGGVLAADKVGEIVMRGDMVMRRYWNNNEETSSTFIDGWLRTGDMGYKDSSGYIYLKGRKSELINVGGLKVSPVETEEILMTLDGIEDCACVGIPDPGGLSGEAIKAFMVSGEFDVASRPTTRQIVSHLREKTEPYKIPKAFEWVDSIPRTRSGKVQRQLLQ